LGPGTVSGADEQNTLRAMLGPWREVFQRTGGEPDIAAAPVGFGAVACGQACCFQGAQVVGQQVGGHSQLCLEFRRGEIPEGQQIDNAQAGGIGEGCMLGDPRLESVPRLNFH
jgi:hypothetical protein